MSTTTPNQHAELVQPPNEATVPSPKGDDKGTTEYMAPFFPYDGVPLKPNYYAVSSLEYQPWWETNITISIVL